MVKSRPLAACLAALTISACARTSSDAPGSDSGKPERGGTLLILASSEPDHLSTSSGYLSQTWQLFRPYTRQLLTYPTEGDFKAQTTLAPDLATVIPTRENGGISADFKTWTFHLRRGVRWNTKPPRDVSAGDVLLGIKMMCNPASPYGAAGYYESTITGLKEYCRAFGKVAGVPSAIKGFIHTHEVAGVRASDDTTLVFSLIQPASDFLHIIATPFASPMPVEYLGYVPDGPDFRTHTISDGPYQITKYAPNRELVLARNPAWDPAMDPLRTAFVDTIRIMFGFTPQSVQLQLQAGTADLPFDVVPPASDLASLIASKDPNLVIGPDGDAYPGYSALTINLLSPNAGGALRQLKVRQAIAYAVDRLAIAQVGGGRALARPLRQVVPAGSSGFVDGYDPFPSPGDRGDIAKARQLLVDAGYPNGLALTLVHGNTSTYPQTAQALQAALARAGIVVQLIPASTSDLWGKYATDPESARRGLWDLLLGNWSQDWFGNNGRSMIEQLFDGRTFGPGSYNAGDYNNDQVNVLIDSALTATTDSSATRLWTRAVRLVTEEVARVPLVETKQPVYHSSRTHNCRFSPIYLGCDLNSVWLRGAARRSGQ